VDDDEWVTNDEIDLKVMEYVADRMILEDDLEVI
jgi:hypothetical protein